MPKLSLNDVAAVTYHATGAECSDTGLAHLAAVTLFGVTNPKRIGTHGENQQHIVSDLLDLSQKNVKKGQPIGMEDISVKQVIPVINEFTDL